MNIPRINNKMVVVLAGVFVLAVVFGNNMFIQPFFKKSASVKVTYDQEKNKKALVDEISAIRAHISEFKSKFVSRKEVSNLIQELSEMAMKSGLDLSAVSPGKSEIQVDYEKTILSLQATGNYHQLGDFVSRVESDPRFLKIESLNVFTETHAKGRTLKINLVVAVYQPLGAL